MTSDVKLTELLAKEPVIRWANGAKIPWNDPAFSRRMLREHLSQEHDRASRRFETIDRHVAWIHDRWCEGKIGRRILDLGCGPGFYTARLARLGHICVGIDYSPASIEYARADATDSGLSCEYQLRDIRSAHFTSAFDLVLLISGELNTFQPSEAQVILDAANGALRPGGRLVVEVHPESFVRTLGAGGHSWYTASNSLFSDQPHLCLKECLWHQQQRVATERYFVVSLNGGDITTFISTTQAYSNEQYESLLGRARFHDVERYPSLAGGAAKADDEHAVYVARRNPAA